VHDRDLRGSREGKQTIRPSSFRRRQFLTLLALAAIPVVIAAGIALPNARDSIVRRTTAQLHTVADLKTVQVKQWLDQGREVIRLIPRLHDMDQMLPLLLETPEQKVRVMTRDRLHAELRAITEIFPSVQAVSLLHPDSGRVLVSTDAALEGRERGGEDYFRPGRRELYVSPVQYSLGREAPVLNLSAPLRDDGGELQAVVTAEMALSDLEATLGSRAGLGLTGQAYLVDAHGFYVTLPTNLEGGPLRSVAESEGVRRARAGEDGSDTYLDPQGVSVLGVYRQLAEGSLGLLVEMEEAELTGQITRVWTLIILLNLGLLVLAAIAARYLANWLIKPLTRIAEAARALSTGDMSRRVPSTGADEIGQLATTFNDMADALQRSHEGLEHLVEERTTGLQRAEARLENIVQTAPDAIISADENQCIIMVNQAAEKMFGCATEDIIGRHIGTFVSETHCRPINLNAESSSQSPSGPGRTNAAQETFAWRKNGEMFPVEASVSQVAAAGQLVRTIILRDITKRKQAEESLRRSEERFRQLVETMNDGLGVVDRDGTITYVNDTLCEMVGYSRDELLGQTVTERLLDEINRQVFEEQIQALQSVGSRPYEIELKRKDGSKVSTISSPQPLMDADGNARGSFAIITDITNLKQAEEELRQLNEKLEQRVDERTAELRTAQVELLKRERLSTLGQLTATVSHEIRNPLGTMRNATYVIQKALQDSDSLTSKSVELLTRNIERCDKIIDELLDFARPRDIELLSVPVDAWLGDLLAELTVPDGLEIQCDLTLPGVAALIDQDRLRRTVVNIYENACQAMTGDAPGRHGEGPGRLTIRTRSDAGRIEILLSDTGPGIPPEILPKIFEPLFSSKNFGVGLGLPTAKQIAEQHGGGIEVESEAKSGTRFIIWLPMPESAIAAVA
jgi:PAS domain S-box-containing protein